jgi:hypothetical protein
MTDQICPDCGGGLYLDGEGRWICWMVRDGREWSCGWRSRYIYLPKESSS